MAYYYVVHSSPPLESSGTKGSPGTTGHLQQLLCSDCSKIIVGDQ